MPQPPSPALLAAIKRAYTPAVRETVLKSARGHVEMLIRQGARVGEDDARELEQAAIADTVLGEVVWDPEAKDLTQHLIGVVKSRAFNEYRRLRRNPQDSIDDAAVAQDAERQLEIAARPDREAVDCDAALAELRSIAAHDAEVLRLVDSFERGVKRADVMQTLGWSAKTYNTTRERMRRYTRRLRALGHESESP